MSTTAANKLNRDHLFAITCRQDNLVQFINDWNEVIMDVTDDIDYGTITYYFREGLNKASIMKPYLRMYDLRNFETQPEDDYCYLYAQCVSLMKIC